MTSVFIISAPSGSGKSTLVKAVREWDPSIHFSVSYTTRQARGQEQPGTHYNYISREEFEARMARDEFLEHAQVFGHYYGTHRGVLDQARQAGCDLMLDIDVQGARQLKDRIADAVTIFVLAPSREELEHRLRARSEDSEEVIQRRLREAAEEIRNYQLYDYVIVNDRIEASAETLRSIIRAERVRRTRSEERILPILRTFETSHG
ncbi:MAG: guanylate kinase [Acidobacteria bacterium]|nr:guanylate kinase [Acidobacteriota bacterium]